MTGIDPAVMGRCPQHGLVEIDLPPSAHVADDGPTMGMGHHPMCLGDCRRCPVPEQLDPRYECGPVTPVAGPAEGEADG